MAAIEEGFRANERLAVFATYVVVSLMMACVVFSVVQFGEYIAPGWDGGYLLPMGFLVGLEALYAQRFVRDLGAFSPDWLKYRISELVVLLIGSKAILYVLRGIDQLWVDLPLWRQNFANNFFTGEYFFTVLLLLVVWASAGVFSDWLMQLEGDEKLLRMERESGIYEERPAIRRQMATTIFAIGGFLIFLAAMMRLDWQALWGRTPPKDVEVFNIMAYFVLALILLGMTQFSILRVHWALDRIPIGANVASHWIIYSAAFLLLVGIVAALLPTSYSVGLLGVLSTSIQMVSSVVGLILVIILAPLFLILSLLANLLGRKTPIPPPEVDPLLQGMRQQMSGAPLAEWLKSLLFWTLFLGVVLYSLYHFVSKNEALMDQLRSLRITALLRSAWRGLVGWMSGVNASIAAGVQASLRRLRIRQAASQVAAWGYVNLRRLPPREKVFFYYLALVRRGGEQGLKRQPFQTPYEYARSLDSQVPEVERDVNTLTEQFIEARYSRHEITAEHASLVQRSWEQIKRALKRRPGS